MNNRAYSILNIKAFDDAKRTFSGMATTPEPDRVGDIVEPMGVQYKNPSPLLWMHFHDLPVGSVVFGKPTPAGVPFTATVAQVLEPIGLKSRLDEAWESVKAGLVRAVSIGFKALEWSVMEEGGFRFTKTELLELSLVTVPANSGATISSIKSLDQQYRKAAIGNTPGAKIKDAPPGVSGNKSTVKLTPKEGNTMTLAEKIKKFKDELAAKNLKRGELANKSADEGQTFDEAEQEEFDALSQEIEQIEKHIARLETVEKSEMKTAKPVTEKDGKTEEGAAQARQGNARITVTQTLPKGLAFARLAKCKALSQKDQIPAYEIASNLYPDDQRIANILKAAVSGATTAHATWAGPLVGDESSIFADFAEFLRPQTIIGKFGTDGIPSLRRVPFRTRLISQTSGGQGYWVGEGQPKPLTKFDFAGTSIEPLKVANIAVATMELLRDSSPSAELLIRDGLTAALRELLDIDFVDINKAATSTSPASITNNITRVTSTGTTADDVRCDVAAVMAAFIAANNAPTTGVWIMSATTALALSLMVNALGQREFPGLTMAGGTFAGLPVIVSEYVPSDSNGSFVILVNASDIYLADEGGVEVKMSDQASLQMLDGSSDGAGVPTNNVVTPTATSLVSMFQTNSVAFLAERTINWARRREDAVGVIDSVNWGACPAS